MHRVRAKCSNICLLILKKLPIGFRLTQYMQTAALNKNYFSEGVLIYLMGVLVADVQKLLVMLLLLLSPDTGRGLAEDGLLVVHEGDGLAGRRGRAGPAHLAVEAGLKNHENGPHPPKKLLNRHSFFWVVCSLWSRSSTQRS